jgi:hypothetical protein
MHMCMSMSMYRYMLHVHAIRTVCEVALIFRGQGKVYNKERHLYHPDVDVYFQAKAWCDRPFASEWFDRAVKPWVNDNYGGKPWLLYADSLDAQRCFTFVDAVKKTNGEVLYGPRGKTDGWQPIDCGCIGAMLKALFRQEQ